MSRTEPTLRTDTYFPSPKERQRHLLPDNEVDHSRRQSISINLESTELGHSIGEAEL